jgi:DNA-binding HxlR family transcriptional regulator
MTSYGHFCLAARTLETVGDRWSLLIVRDLLPAPRRFSDLRRLLTHVTAKWLTIRLRQLESEGIVVRNPQPGRREVWYELTDKGRDLAPVLDALIAWGLKHERRPLDDAEAAHPEHLMAGIAVALNDRGMKPAGRRVWTFDFDSDGSFSLAFDDGHWSLTDGASQPDVVVVTTPRGLAEFIATPREERRLPSAEIRLSGEADRVTEVVEAFGARPA